MNTTPTKLMFSPAQISTPTKRGASDNDEFVTPTKKARNCESQIARDNSSHTLCTKPYDHAKYAEKAKSHAMKMAFAQELLMLVNDDSLWYCANDLLDIVERLIDPDEAVPFAAYPILVAMILGGDAPTVPQN